MANLAFLVNYCEISMNIWIDCADYVLLGTKLTYRVMGQRMGRA